MIFGVAGVPTNYKGKYKDLFNWLRELNLNAFEIQCVYGFKISDVNKQIIINEKEKGFNFSIHRSKLQVPSSTPRSAQGQMKNEIPVPSDLTSYFRF